MKSPSPPAAPDPVATANAQAAMNKDTAVAQYGLNASNQTTPEGSITWSQNGTWADGTPRFSSTQTYSPEQQRLYELGNKTQQNLGQIGVDQSARIGKLLSQPFQGVDTGPATDFSADRDETEKAILARLQPSMDQDRAALESRLANQGIAYGTKAYESAMGDYNRSVNDARLGAVSASGAEQSRLHSMRSSDIDSRIQRELAQRNQPINEISALLSGSQVSMPQFGQTPQAGVAPTDYIGAVNNKYQGEMAAYNAKQQSNNAMMSGLFGLAGAGLGGWMRSDIDAKENIEVTGERPDGLHTIDFDYKPEEGLGGERHSGFVAQEVAQIYPHAVARDASGRLAVNYAKVPGGLFELGANDLRRAA